MHEWAETSLTIHAENVAAISHAKSNKQFGVLHTNERHVTHKTRLHVYTVSHSVECDLMWADIQCVFCALLFCRKKAFTHFNYNNSVRSCSRHACHSIPVAVNNGSLCYQPIHCMATATTTRKLAFKCAVENEACLRMRYFLSLGVKERQ